VFVCPSDPNKGLAPTNSFDYQVPRLSYVSNEVLMGRPRAHFTAVSDSEIDDTSSLIMLTDMTNYKFGIGGSSGASGAAPKSHRPTNAFNPWNNDSAGAASYAYVTAAEAYAAEQSAKNATDYLNTEDQTHLRYNGITRHSGGANYSFADGHVKWMKIDDTISRRLWGNYFYSLNNDAPVN
jgi:prepilin-type processing-associated H-X9-DG protein